MDFTISSDMRMGAVLPGISAVVITISESETRCSRSSACFFLYSSDVSFAYPPSPTPSSEF